MHGAAPQQPGLAATHGLASRCSGGVELPHRAWRQQQRGQAAWQHSPPSSAARACSAARRRPPCSSPQQPVSGGAPPASMRGAQARPHTTPAAHQRWFVVPPPLPAGLPRQLVVQAATMTRRESTEKRHRRIRSKVGGADQRPLPPRSQPACCRRMGGGVHKGHVWIGWQRAGGQRGRGAARQDAAAALNAARPCTPPPQVEGTPERPRLAVFRSNNHIYAQVGAPCSGGGFGGEAQPCSTRRAAPPPSRCSLALHAAPAPRPSAHLPLPGPPPLPPAGD